MLALPVVALLVVTAAPLKVAAPGLQGVGIDPKQLAFFNEHLADALEKQGVDVFTAAELGSLLGLERQKQLLGCADEASNCLAEIAGGLGVDAVLLGTIARVGDGWQLDSKVIDAHTGKRLATYQANARSEQGLLSELDAAGSALSKQTLVSAGATLVSVRRAGNAFIPVGAVGVVAAVVGVVLVARSASIHDSLVASPTQGMLMPGDGPSLVSQGKVLQPVGWAAVGVGAACIAAAVVLFAWRTDVPQLALVVDGHGGGLALSGVWP